MTKDEIIAIVEAVELPTGWEVILVSKGRHGFGVQAGKRSVMIENTEKAKMTPGSSILDDQPFLVRASHKSLAEAVRLAGLKAQDHDEKTPSHSP